MTNCLSMTLFILNERIFLKDCFDYQPLFT